jgi:hypothetical protein
MFKVVLSRPRDICRCDVYHFAIVWSEVGKGGGNRCTTEAALEDTPVGLWYFSSFSFCSSYSFQAMELALGIDLCGERTPL